MRLRKQLIWRSTLIFAATLGFVGLGTSLLFQFHTTAQYNQKLFDRAELAAYFYLEKDEMSPRTYTAIESQFNKIYKESVRLYHAGDQRIYIPDSLDFEIPTAVLERALKREQTQFQVAGRQAVALHYQDNQGDFIIVVSGIDQDGKKQSIALRWLLLGFCVIGLLFHYFLTNILARKTFSPFARIIKKVNNIKPNDLSVRLHIPPGKPDEIKDLMQTFNYFLERLENSMEIQQNFLKNASHELKTPLAILIGEIQIGLSQARTNEEYRTILETLKRDGMHLNALVEGLLILSNLQIPSQTELSTIRVDEVLWKILEKQKISYPDTKISIDFQPITDLEVLTVQGNKELLFIALNNLVDNAIKFSNNKPVKIVVEQLENKLRITIEDQGIGIAAEELEKIFELFYRSRQHPEIQGHGIGLYLIKQVLDLHGIRVNIQSQVQSGTSIRLYFP